MHKTVDSLRAPDTPTGIGANRPARSRDFHVGYSPVLLRTDLKESLKRFRRDLGFGHDSHIERCLMSAAIELLLSQPELHEGWINGLADATRKDVMLASQSAQASQSSTEANRPIRGA